MRKGRQTLYNYYILTEEITIGEKLEDIRDNIDIVAAFHPANEYEILERVSNQLTDIILELKKKEPK